MKHQKTSLVVAATSLLALGSSLSSTNADTLVSYDFVSDYSQTAGTATGSDVSYGSFDAGTLNSTHGRSGATDSLFVRESATGADAAAGDTLAKAITLGNYAGFTLTNSTTSTIDLGSFSFDIFFEPYNFTGPVHSVFVMSDSSGFTDGNQLGGVTYASGTAPDFGEGDPPDTITVDLSSLGNLAVSDTIEFRLYFVDDSDSNDHIFRVNNITVTGSVTSGGGNTFADWIDGWGLDAADKDFTDDPDGDGLDNGLEAFFGTNPAEAGQGLTQVTKSGNLFSFQHPEADPALSDVTGSYEWSIDLQNWFPQGTVGDTTVTISPSKDDPVTGTTTVTADTSSSTIVPAKLFLRVVATQ